MQGLIIGEGSMSGKGLYAARDFRKGEVVVKYEPQPIVLTDRFICIPSLPAMYLIPKTPTLETTTNYHQTILLLVKSQWLRILLETSSHW